MAASRAFRTGAILLSPSSEDSSESKYCVTFARLRMRMLRSAISKKSSCLEGAAERMERWLGEQSESGGTITAAGCF